MHVALTINFCELGIADKENWESTYVNPLSAKSDQHQISPCNINAL